MPRQMYHYIVSVHSDEHLASAKRLAALASASPERHDVALLSGAALIFAIAHLSHAVEVLLVDALLKEQGRRRKTRSDAQREIAVLGLPARLDMLPKKVGLVLRRNRPRPNRLLAAVRLRNRLVHPEGVVLAGSADDLDGFTGDMAARSRSSRRTIKHRVRTAEGDVVFGIPLPTSSWNDVKGRTGHEAIEDVEVYLNDLYRLSQHQSETSEFFSVASTLHH